MKKTSNPIIFFGNEKLATGIPGAKPIIRDAVRLGGFEIEQHVTGKLSELKPHKAQLAVLAAYGRIIPQVILDQFPLGIINIHPSLLPQHRGSTPIEQAILDGASRTGVSIMRLTAGMDEGPIYKQKTVHLTGHESKVELSERLQQLGSELLVEVLPAIADGSLTPRSQSHTERATYTKLLTKEDGIIDWRKPADQLEREIRAYLGWPGSRTLLAGKDVVVTATAVSQESGVRSQELEPGTVIIENKQLCIVCSDGNLLLIKKLKPAGKKEMDAEAFINGYLR